MSGPKRAEVRPDPAIARAAARAAAARVSQAELQSIKGLLDRAKALLIPAELAAASLAEAARDVASARGDAAGAADARDAITQAQSRLKAAQDAVALAKREAKAARQAEAAAQEAYDRGTRSGHRYDPAEGRRASEAAAARGRARSAASTALSEAQRCEPEAAAAMVATEAVRRESARRAKAEAEARRVAQAALRGATAAVGQAAGAVAGLDVASTDTFTPGRREALERRIADAQARLQAGDAAAAQKAVAGVEAEAAALGREAARAKAEFDARSAACETALGELDAAIQAADPDLIAAWADDPGALDAARSGLAQAREAANRGQFEDAGTRAQALTAAIVAATASAATAREADERRTSIGDAVMDVLEELGFDVSFDPGSRTEPLRISGQTASADGRGDFDIEIPLHGEIDFEVTAAPGDGSCSAAVAGLQERLAARGVEWETTDWGYGHEPAAQQPRAVREEVRTQVRTHGGGGRSR